MKQCKVVDSSYFELAPMQSSATVRIQATGEQVFDCFRDADAWPRWAPAIRRVEWTSPEPFEVGTTRTVHMLGGAVGEEVFIAWSPGRRMAFCFTRTDLPSESFAEDYLVLPDPDGGVSVVWTIAMTPTGIGAKFSPVTGPLMGRFQKLLLGRLAKLVESEYT